MIRTIFLYSYVVVVLILSLPILLVEWIIGKFNPHAKDVSCLWTARTFLLKPVLFFMGAKITAYGVENIPSDRPVVYMANHRGMMDCLLLYKYFKGVCGFVAKAEVKKIPLVNIWMNNLNCLYVDRDDIRDGLKMILAGIEKLKNGTSICIMPEGTRSKTDELLPIADVCKSKGVTVIGVTENTASPLAQKSDIVIRMAVTRECDKYNCQGTTSFAVTCAIFDALQTAVIDATDFKNEKFAVIHPGGAVGKRLNQ